MSKHGVWVGLAARRLRVMLGVVVVGAMLALPAAVRADETEDRKVQEMVAEFEQLLASGQGPKALQQVESMQQRYPEHPLVLAVVGQVQMLQNNVPAATASLTKALEKEPNQPRATILLANIEFRTGRGEEAYKRVEAALAVHKEHLELLVMLGQMRVARQDFDEAEKVFDKVLGIEDAPAQAKATAYAQIATIKAQQGEHDKAAIALTEAMKLQWHPDLAMALVEQSEKAGDVEKTRAAITDFKSKLNNAQLAPIRQQALARLEPIERRMELQLIGNQLDKGETYAAKLALDRFKRGVLTNAAAQTEYGPAVRRLELLERTQYLKSVMDRGQTPDWLANIAQEVNELAKGQEGEHVDAALALAAEAQNRVDEVLAREVPGVVELLKSGVTLQQLDLPDKDMKEKLEAQGLKPYRELSSAAKQAIEDYFKPMSEAREPAPFESLVLPYLEKPTDPTLRQALLDSYWKQVEKFDTKADGASRQQIIPDRIFTRPGSSGPSIGGILSHRRENDAYTARDQFNDADLIKARRWQDVIEGYRRSEAIYPRPNVLEDIGRAYFYAGDYRAASDYMALSAAVDMYERAHSFRPGTGVIMDGGRDLMRLSWAQSLRALAEGKRVVQGPGKNAALFDVMDDIKNKRWVEVAQYVVDKHEDSPIDSWFASQIKFGSQVHRDEMIAGLDATAQATDDPQRFAELEKIAESLYVSNLPVFALPKAKAAENDEKRLQLLRWSLTTDLRHAEVNNAIAQVLERQGNLKDALGHYNAAALGKKTANLAEADRKAAAQERDRLLVQLRGEKGDFAYLAELTNESYQILGADFRNRYMAALTEAYVNTLMELGINDRRNALQIRSDARRAMGDWQAAIDDLNEIIKMDPNHQNAAQLQCVLGDCYQDLAQPEKAMQHYNLSAEAGYRDARLFNNRGDLHRSANNTEAALADYSSAIEIDPNNQYALTKRSEIYEYVLKDDDKALADLKKVEQMLKDQGKDTILSTVGLRIHNIMARKINKTFGGE